MHGFTRVVQLLPLSPEVSLLVGDTLQFGTSSGFQRLLGSDDGPFELPAVGMHLRAVHELSTVGFCTVRVRADIIGHARISM